MSLLNKMKQATGVGLDGASSYGRAFEKGVLLGDHAAGIVLFQEAATKLQREGDAALAARATANAQLYAFLAQPRAAALVPLRDALAAAPEIEQTGSQSEMMPTAPLVAELSLRIVEQRLPQTPPSAAITGHEQAKKLLEPILDRQLLLYRSAPLPGEGPLVESAASRYYWHHGMSCYNAALATFAADPSAAASQSIAAAQAFQQCGDSQRQTQCEQMAHDLQLRRTCWLCHREMQALGTNFNWYATSLTPYVQTLLQRAGEDAGSIDTQQGAVVLCTPCAAVIERRVEQAVALRLKALEQQVQSALNALDTRLSRIESR